MTPMSDARYNRRKAKKDKQKIDNLYEILGINGPIGPMSRYSEVHQFASELRTHIPRYASRIKLVELPIIPRDAWEDVVYKKSVYTNTTDFKFTVLHTIAKRLARDPNKRICIMYVDYTKDPEYAPRIFHQPTSRGYNYSYTGSWRVTSAPWCIYLWTESVLKKKLDEVFIHHIHEV